MRFILAGLFVCLLTGVQSQSKKEFNIGEPFPYDGTFIVNGNIKKTVSVSDLKGKPLVVELFSSTCVVCFQMLPKMNSLNQRFKDKLNFLLVGYQDGKVNVMYEKFRKKLKLELPVAFDSLLFKKVRLESVPTYIWVKADNTIAAVTGPQEMNEINLEKFISNDHLSFGARVRKVPFDFWSPYLVNGNGGPDSNFLLRTLLGKWNPSLPFKAPLDLTSFDSTHTLNFIGASINSLYKYAYWGRSTWGPEVDIYGKIWRTPIMENESDSPPIDSQRYCYSISCKTDRIPDVQRTMQKDLQLYFGYEANVQTRSMPCWVISLQQPKATGLRSKERDFSGSFDHTGIDYKHIKMRELVNLLEHYNNSDMQFIDETGIDYPIDIKVTALLTEQADFFEALAKVGIIVQKGYRTMKVLVLSKPKNVAAR